MRRPELAALLALWLATACGLQLLTTRVADWFVMTDELLYERLAISIAHGRSPLPRVHGALVPSIDQLYPLLIAPVFGAQLVPDSLHAAHFLNAFVICSACIPAYLLVRQGRAARARHRTLAWAYGLLAAGTVVLLATGHTASALGTYGSTLRGNLLPTDSGRSFAEHAAVVALGLGVLPFVVGVAWLLANAVRRNTFAVLASVTLLALIAEVTVFDLRFAGGGGVRDRYLFYAAPLVLAGFACALVRPPWPRWSLRAPALLAAPGFGAARLPRYDTATVDTPVSVLDDALVRSSQSLAGARIFLVAATILLVVCFVARGPLAIAVVLVTLAAVPAETAYAWVRLFRVPDTAGRPLTHPDAGRFTWLDQAVGSRPNVTLVPYPTLPGDYWASVGAWWDLEFWNASAARAAYYPR